MITIEFLQQLLNRVPSQRKPVFLTRFIQSFKNKHNIAVRTMPRIPHGLICVVGKFPWNLVSNRFLDSSVDRSSNFSNILSGRRAIFY